jgi:hypothetical protein
MPLEQRTPDTQTDEDLKALEAFVVDNDDLLALESIIGRFNIFDALSIARAEIRHSNFLAFILDPAESHGQGQVFLKAVLMDLLKAAPPTLRPFSPIELDGADLRGIVVRREWEHIDLFISCQHPPFVIVIENKVDSKEHSDQLGRYKATMKHHFPDHRPLYVYLTPEGEEPSEGEWVSYSYSHIYRVLNRVRTTYNNAIGEDVLVFLDHYLNLIGTRFMNETEESKRIDDLCQRIYKNHRVALDLIYERVGNPASGVLTDAEMVLREDPRWHVFYRASKHIDFVPREWLDWLPRVGLDSSNDPRSWFVFRFALYPKSLDLYVEVRRMDDLAKRRAIIDKLITEGQRFGFKHSGREITDNYTRVSGREKLLRWNEDEEPESGAIRVAVKKKLDEKFPKLEDVPSVLRPLL